MDMPEAFRVLLVRLHHGDDWGLAAGVLAALVIAWAAARIDLVEWLWLPLLVIIVLATSHWRTAEPRD
jgi:hypothetical protein